MNSPHFKEITNRFSEFYIYEPGEELPLRNYIGTQLPIIGLAVPEARKLYGQGYSFNEFPLEKQLDIWEDNWFRARVFDQMSQSLFFMNKHLKKFEADMLWSRLVKWQARVDNWAHSDEISGYYSYLLEIIPKQVLPQLKEWNMSKNHWERRQSLVALLFYHRFRKKVLPFNTLINLIQNLLTDPEYMVQKGVGWSLRELYQAYPKETIAFLMKHHGHLTSTAFASASEKLSAEIKEELKGMRKIGRKK